MRCCAGIWASYVQLAEVLTTSLSTTAGDCQLVLLLPSRLLHAKPATRSLRLQVVVSLLMTLKLGIARYPRQLLWSSTLFSFLALVPSALHPQLYVRRRATLTFASRVVLAVLMPELVYQLTLHPYKGSSVVTPTGAAFFGKPCWHRQP